MPTVESEVIIVLQCCNNSVSV